MQAADRYREVSQLLRVQVVVAVQPLPTVLPQVQVQMLRLMQELPPRAMATAGQVRTWPEIPHAAGHRH